jgi:hypothetical protein
MKLDEGGGNCVMTSFIICTRQILIIRMINWLKMGTGRHLARGEYKKFENNFRL